MGNMDQLQLESTPTSFVTSSLQLDSKIIEWNLLVMAVSIASRAAWASETRDEEGKPLIAFPPTREQEESRATTPKPIDSPTRDHAPSKFTSIMPEGDGDHEAEGEGSNDVGVKAPEIRE